MASDTAKERRDRRGIRRMANDERRREGRREKGRRVEEGDGLVLSSLHRGVNREVLGSRLNAITCHLLRSCVYTARPVGSLAPQVGLDPLSVYLGITNTGLPRVTVAAL